MFAQANSRALHYKIFNAKWNVTDLKKITPYLIIKETSKASPNGIISAYKDSAITEGNESSKTKFNENNQYLLKKDDLNN